MLKGILFPFETDRFSLDSTLTAIKAFKTVNEMSRDGLLLGVSVGKVKSINMVLLLLDKLFTIDHHLSAYIDAQA